MATITNWHKMALLIGCLLLNNLSYGQTIEALEFRLKKANDATRTAEFIRTPEWTPYGFSFYSNGAERMYLYADQLKVRVPIYADNSFRLAGAYSQGLGSLFQVDAAGTPGGRFHINESGLVGIGTATPRTRLEVKGTGGGNIDLLVNGRIRTGDPGNMGGVWLDNANTQFVGQFDANKLGLFNNNGWRMVVDNVGNVGIGTTNPLAKLDVNGDARLSGNVLIGNDMTRFQSAGVTAKKATYGLWVEKGVVAKDYAIATPTTWADFVFAPGYRLPLLAETERYIRQHGHLPEMPSEAEVRRNGYSVHEMNTRLLQKIEELTLHSIDQEKQLAETRTLLQPYAELAAEVARLKAKLDK